jgi:RHS repeat-associated protein
VAGTPTTAKDPYNGILRSVAHLAGNLNVSGILPLQAYRVNYKPTLSSAYVAFTPSYLDFELTDHLGNVRAMVQNYINTSSGQPQGSFTADYYPFGMKMAGRTTNSNQSRYGFNGKEYDDETGETDFGARMYDASTGRWHAVDKASYIYPSLSPYGYTKDNPVWFIELDGMVFDFSNLTPEQKAKYDAKIKILM